MTELVAGVELGGTKINCILASGPDRVEDEVRLPTTGPDEAMAAVEHVLDGWRERAGGFAAIGVASFGPAVVERSSPAWGSIALTPKPGWSNVDVAGRLGRRFGVPLGFHTDVVGAALAEARWGAAAGLADVAYVTVGTGVGVGLIAGGRPLGGLSHPELGHLRPARLAGDDWIGVCPFHGGCVEGLASGPAIRARAGVPAEDLPPDHPAWGPTVHALAQLAHAVTLTGVPRRIVWGGGVMTSGDMLPRLRQALHHSLGGYVALPEVSEFDTYLVGAALGGRAGPLGAILLGQQALEDARTREMAVVPDAQKVVAAGTVDA